MIRRTLGGGFMNFPGKGKENKVCKWAGAGKGSNKSDNMEEIGTK